MINARKEFADISFENECLWIDSMCRAQEFGKSIYSGVRALANPTRITIVNEPSFVDWFDHIAERVLHHAVSKGQRRHLAFLWLVNCKAMVNARAIATAFQFVVQVQQLVFQVHGKEQGVVVVSLVSARLEISGMESIKTSDLRPQMAECFWHF